MAVTATQQDFFRVQLYSPKDSSLGETRLLIPIEAMLEAMTLLRQDICPMPGVPRGVAGVTNQRGQLIWVTDVRSPVDLGQVNIRPNPQEKLTVILLGQAELGQLGFVVNQLEGIFPFDLSESTPVADKWRRFYPHCDRQIAQGSEAGFILDIPQLFGYLQPR